MEKFWERYRLLALFALLFGFAVGLLGQQDAAPCAEVQQELEEADRLIEAQRELIEALKARLLVYELKGNPQ